MKNQRITIPENTRVIIDGDVIIFESKDPLLSDLLKEEYNTNEWYSAKEYVLLQLDSGVIGFAYGKWYESYVGIPHGIGYAKSDMEEVEKLLIREAEKRGFKVGVSFTTPVTKSKRTVHSNPFINHTQEGLCVNTGVSGVDTSIFDFETGKWAEIVEEKKPYINCYDTKLSEGDEFHWINNNLKIYDGGKYDETKQLSDWCLFIGTDRECHRYLYENWDKFNK